MAVRTYIIETEFAKIDNPQSSTTYIVLDDNDPTSVNKVVFKTNNINKEGEIYTVQNGQPAPVQKTCSFKFNSDGQFQFIKNGYGSYYLKVNDGEWTEYTESQTVSVVNGDVIELKSDVKQTSGGSTIKFNDYPSGAAAAVSWELEGDLLGTLYGDTFPNWGGYQMFKGCIGLTKVPNDMFINYAYVPEGGCRSMFEGCTSLTTAPALPATTLAQHCYNSTFSGCTSLTTAPALPATTLAQYSYQYMFEGCTSLTTAPELPATSITLYAYQYMFKGCTSLNYVKCLARYSVNATNLRDWLSGVAATGTFVKDASASYSTGASGIPSGWTIEDAE